MIIYYSLDPQPNDKKATTSLIYTPISSFLQVVFRLVKVYLSISIVHLLDEGSQNFKSASNWAQIYFINLR